MNDEIITLLDGLMDMEENIYGIAMVDGSGQVLWQTENWDLSADAPAFINAWNNNASSVTLLSIKYMIVENTPERLIGTNVTGKGHIIGASAGPNKIICYINPVIGPRDALQDIQLQCTKIAKLS
ncbi:hypothetical protein GF325_18555 [Candidatus Bathyarchaeota archaeon]|nr:hypothetical protein [Candidatus Bathyarchaeota archaeon]